MRGERSAGDVYANRTEAGRILARALADYRDEQPAVIALPRGGVPVGFEVARALGVPLELWVVRKLAAPLEPRLAIGAIAEGGARYVDWDEAHRRGASPRYVEEIARQEQLELDRRVERFRQGRPPPELAGRTVIIVDDGLATGRTLRAVLQGIRRQRPAEVIVAVPVAPEVTLRSLAPLVDALVCPQVEKDVYAVDDSYDDFHLPTDDEVVELIRRAWRALPPLAGQPSQL